MTTVNKPHYQASWRSVVLLIVFCAVIVLIPIGAAVIAKKNSYQQYASEYQRIDTSDIDSEEAGYGDPADMSGYWFLSKGGGAGFLLESPETACNVIESGTALIYIGSDSCQWCQRAVPVLDTVSNDEHFAILYVDASKISQDQIKSLEEESLLSNLRDF